MISMNVKKMLATGLGVLFLYQGVQGKTFPQLDGNENPTVSCPGMSFIISSFITLFFIFVSKLQKIDSMGWSNCLQALIKASACRSYRRQKVTNLSSSMSPKTSMWQLFRIILTNAFLSMALKRTLCLNSKTVRPFVSNVQVNIYVDHTKIDDFILNVLFAGFNKIILQSSFLQLASSKIVPVDDQDTVQNQAQTAPAPTSSNHGNGEIVPAADSGTNDEDNVRRRASMVENTLEEAAEAGRKLRFRITMVAFSVGLFFWFTFLILGYVIFTDHSYLGALLAPFVLPCGCIMLLGIMQDDVVLIRVINLLAIVGFVLFGFSRLVLSYNSWFVERHAVRYYEGGEVLDTCGANLPQAGCAAAASVVFTGGLVNICFSASCVPSVLRVPGIRIWESGNRKGLRFQDRAFKISSRQALSNIWYNFRWHGAALGMQQLCYAAVAQSLGDRYPSWTDERFAAKMFTVCSNFAIFFIFNSKNRGRMTAFLGAITTEADARSAASIAALLGNVKASESLAMAQGKFRSIAFNRLAESDFESNREGANNENVLFGKTNETRLGQCDAFISHSWSDNGKQKYAALKQWCQDFKSKHKREPQLWLDKACINQKDISNDLLCLPVFLAGCETLLIIPGPTYTSRLWCIMEVFVFLKMGGSVQRITIIPIELKDEKTAKAKFEEVDVSKCKCYLEKDRQKLLGIVEKGFGSYEAFNKAFRHVFDQRMSTIITQKNIVSSRRVSIYRVDETEQN